MSPLAEVLHGAGVRITGSDAHESGAVELDNEIYPALKKMFHVSVESMEIAMRRAIGKVWLHTDLETIQREYTQYVDPEKGHPELKEFIGYYGNKYR